MTKASWMTAGVAVVALAVACSAAWLVYRESAKRELQQQVTAVAEDATARLRQSLELLTAGPEARAELEANFAALEESVETTQALDDSIHPELVAATHAYITDVHALLRRELALHAGRDAVGAGIGAINHHLQAAGARSPEWIHQALALKQQLEKSFFDYRLAAGGLEKSLNTLGDTSLKLQAFVPSEATIEADPILGAQKHLLDLSTQMERQVENARILPGSG
jgi:hypothetical protein